MSHDEQGSAPERGQQPAVPDYPAGLDERTRERLDDAFAGAMRSLDDGEYARRRAIAEAAGGWRVVWAAEEGGDWVCRVNGEELLTLAAEDFAALVSDPAPVLELTPVPLVDREAVEREVSAFAAQLEGIDANPLGLDGQTVGRLSTLAAERVEALDPAERERRRAAAGGHEVMWTREPDGSVVCHWPDGDPPLLWMSAETFARLVAYESPRVLVDAAGEVRIEWEPSRSEVGQVQRAAIELLRATDRGDEVAAEAALLGVDMKAVLGVVLAGFVDVARELWGREAFAEMLARWQPGQRLGPDLLDGPT